MKFVIHFHESEESHYDLMIERGDSLATWRIRIDEFSGLLSGSEISAERIQDHRRAYLTYEGPVSRGRGRVACYDCGEYTELCWNEKIIEMFVRGGKISGKLSIVKINDPLYGIQFRLNGETYETH